MPPSACLPAQHLPLTRTTSLSGLTSPGCPLALRPMLSLGHEGHVLSPSRMKLDFLWSVLRGPALGVIVVFWDLTKEQRSSGLFVANLLWP